METDAPEFNELGTRRLFEVILFEVFRKNQPVLAEDVEKYCISRIFRSAPQLRSTLRFLEWSLVVIRDGPYLAPTPQLIALCDASSTVTLEVRLALMILARLRETNHFTTVFLEDALSQEPQNRVLYLATSKIPLRYMPLIVLLRNLGLFEDNALGAGVLTVDARIAAAFADAALSSSYTKSRTRRMTLASLKALLAAQEAQGTEAEAFVVGIERKRLQGHPRVDAVRSIAAEDVAAGFDIVSFESAFSLMHDRYIEVKSHKDQVCFYWSRNEFETAQRLGNSYYLFIVDAGRIAESGYTPLVIRNPSETLASSWRVEPETWLATRIL
ncbi:MAG: DUF3883 domain-containing protein [Pseudomonadota bacterium]